VLCVLKVVLTTDVLMPESLSKLLDVFKVEFELEFEFSFKNLICLSGV